MVTVPPIPVMTSLTRRATISISFEPKAMPSLSVHRRTWYEPWAPSASSATRRRDTHDSWNLLASENLALESVVSRRTISPATARFVLGYPRVSTTVLTTSAAEEPGTTKVVVALIADCPRAWDLRMMTFWLAAFQKAFLAQMLRAASAMNPRRIRKPMSGRSSAQRLAVHGLAVDHQPKTSEEQEKVEDEQPDARRADLRQDASDGGRDDACHLQVAGSRPHGLDLRCIHRFS